MTTVGTRQSKVFTENRTIVGVSNGDKRFRLFEGRLIAKVGYTILGDDCIDVVLRVVDV